MNFKIGIALLSLLFYTNNPYFFPTFSKFLSLLFPYFSVVGHLKAWGERQTDIEKETGRQTDSQTHRETDRKRETETDRYRERKRETD